jgi:XTP/dITP diphosphohydrolase
MVHLLLASNNRHKRSEMKGIIRQLAAEVTLLQPADIGFSFDAEENSTTFGGNSLIKARALHGLIRGVAHPGVTSDRDPSEIAEIVVSRLGETLPAVVADDSGICVRALDNRPGVYSARFGDTPDGPALDDEGRNDILLRTLADHSDRDAHYVCNATIILDAERWVQAEETWHGEILRERKPGSTGFGYDPIVWLKDYGCSVAQLPQAQKDRVSHRAKAMRRVLAAAGWLP